MSICRSTSICRDRIPRSASLHGTEGQSTRGLHPCGPIQGSSRRSVTATLRFARHRGRTLVRKKFTHENNFCKPPPDNLRATTRNQRTARPFHLRWSLGRGKPRSPPRQGGPTEFRESTRWCHGAGTPTKEFHSTHVRGRIHAEQRRRQLARDLSCSSQLQQFHPRTANLPGKPPTCCPFRAAGAKRIS